MKDLLCTAALVLTINGKQQCCSYDIELSKKVITEADTKRLESLKNPYKMNQKALKN